METTLDAQKLTKNIITLLNRASVKQLRTIYLVAYEIIKKA